MQYGENNNNFSDDITKINLEWLRYFIILAELKSFSDAAKQLYITQQALSKAISGIEEQLGLRLVDRNKKFNGLTVPGTLFLEKSKIILQNIYDMDKFFSEFKTGKPNGNLKICWASLWGQYLLPKILCSFVQNNPDVYPEVHYLKPNEIEKWVSAGEMEIGLIGNPPLKKDIEFLVGPKFPYIIVGKPQPFKRWDELTYIIPKNWKSFDGMTSSWDDEKFKRKSIIEVDSSQIGLSLCEEGMGAFFTPEITVRESIKRGTLAIVAEPPFEFSTTLYVIWNKNIHKSSAARAFIDIIKQNYEFQRLAR